MGFHTFVNVCNRFCKDEFLLRRRNVWRCAAAFFCPISGSTVSVIHREPSRSKHSSSRSTRSRVSVCIEGVNDCGKRFHSSILAAFKSSLGNFPNVSQIA